MQGLKKGRKAHNKMFQVPAKGRAERMNVMLKIKVSETNGNKVVTAERIGMKNPVFVPA